MVLVVGNADDNVQFHQEIVYYHTCNKPFLMVDAVSSTISLSPINERFIMSIKEQVTSLLGFPPHIVWKNIHGTNYEWHISQTTVERMAPNLVNQLKSLGCMVFNVDSLREPYYFVCVRFKATPK